MTDKKFDIDGVVFDLGSTILEYETRPWPELNRMSMQAAYEFLKRNEHPLPDFETFWKNHLAIKDRFRDQAAETLVEYDLTLAIAEFLISLELIGGTELAKSFFKEYYQPISKQLSMFADAPTVLEQLKTAGKKIGLVSNTVFPESYHKLELDRFKLSEYFDFTIFSVTYGYRKPHPSIYHEAIRLMGIKPERLLFVGDRYIEDVKGPREVGMKSLLKYREGREYPDPMPEDIVVVKSLSEIPPLID